MNFKLEVMNELDIIIFKKEIQKAFQKGFEDFFGPTKGTVLPTKDINQSLNEEGSLAYKAIVDEKVVGGAVIVIDSKTENNELHLLYVDPNIQSKGIGKLIWNEIERLHPTTKVWKTCTPYFDRRNIHFYVNKCHFKIVKYERKINQEGFIGDGGLGMFILEKVMN